jgi:porphobilinogen synthase
VPFDLIRRPRRLRRTPAIRSLVRETTVFREDLVMPLFVNHDDTWRREVASMPGIFQLGLDHLPKEIDRIVAAGVGAVLLFGLPATKDDVGSDTWNDDGGVVQRAVRRIKEHAPDLVVMTDVCFCEYTTHGHCGVWSHGHLDNDLTLANLQKQVVSHARAGADLVAPSGMIDGMVAAIRDTLDGAGFVDLPVMSYAVKYASSFYGPFREAVDSAPQSGDRRGHQMDPANVREAVREAALDLDEGADILMVKPALSYLDVIRTLRDRFDAPLAAYSVSGEYSLIQAAAANGWVDRDAMAIETLLSMKRAGADMLISYFARDLGSKLPSRR